MPNPSHSGLFGDPFAYCDRCGWVYRLGQMVMQNGLLLCLAKCYDNPDILNRDQAIQEALQGDSTEGQSIESLKRSDDVPEEQQF